MYGRIHYQELPELFMDYICSLTGKSPSTTGAGSEGALTKGPFNALAPTADLNNALVSMLLTGYAGFSSAAGYIGPHYRVDHDISLLVPEIWCRLFPHERDPKRLIEAGHLEKLEDYEFDGTNGARQPARLPHHRQVRAHLLRPRVRQPRPRCSPRRSSGPRLQDLAVFADGVDNIVEAQQRVAAAYFADGTIEDACPPLKALLHIMAHGHYEGKDAGPPRGPRALHPRGAARERLVPGAAQRSSSSATSRSGSATCRSLTEFLARAGHRDEAARLGIAGRLEHARAELERVGAPGYLTALVGTIGADPIHRPGQGRWREEQAVAAETQGLHRQRDGIVQQNADLAGHPSDFQMSADGTLGVSVGPGRYEDSIRSEVRDERYT